MMAGQLISQMFMAHMASQHGRPGHSTAVGYQPYPMTAAMEMPKPAAFSVGSSGSNGSNGAACFS